MRPTEEPTLPPPSQCACGCAPTDPPNYPVSVLVEWAAAYLAFHGTDVDAAVRLKVVPNETA